MNKEFKVNILNEDGIKKCQTMATIFNETLDNLVILGCSGREFSIAKTHLETACFFAKKSIALLKENQVP